MDVPVDMPTFHPLRDGKEAFFNFLFCLPCCVPVCFSGKHTPLPTGLLCQARYCYFSGAWRPEGWFPFRSLLKADLGSGTVTNWDAGDGTGP